MVGVVCESGVVHLVDAVFVVGVVICDKFVVICDKALTKSFLYQFCSNFHSMVGVVSESIIVSVVGAVFAIGVLICGK